ncbi:unnamed protein product, partial [Tuber aestivum]
MVRYVATGSYSFAITRDGRVWAWGLNQYGQCGIYDTSTSLRAPGRANPLNTSLSQIFPIIPSSETKLLAGMKKNIAGILKGGSGIRCGGYEYCTIRDTMASPRYKYLLTPHVVPGIRFSFIGRGTNHNIAVSKEGGTSTSYSWGFGGSYQTGLGPDADDEIMTPTKIENTATRGVRMAFATAGEQFSILAGI